MSEPIMGHVVTSDPVPSMEPALTPSVASVLAAAPAAARLDSVESWARAKGTPAWLFKAAAIGARWECGPQVEPCLVTEAEFTRAVAFAENPHAVVNAPKES